MSRRPSDDDLDALLAELSGTLDELRGALAERPSDADRERSRSHRRQSADRPGVPRPPDPRAVLRFTERHTIPTLIAFLEANVRALESLQGLLRLIDGADSDPVDRSRFERAGERTVDRLDRLLDDLQGAVEGEPPDAAARDLLAEARALNSEIDDRVAGRTRERERGERKERDERDTRRRGDEGVRIDVADADRADADSDDGVDVDAELDSLRRQLRDEDEGDADGER